MTLTNAPPSLGEQRGLSSDTLRAFNVRSNGTGWEYDTKCMDGSVATRWKSYYSTRPEGDSAWKKYKWIPSKPAGARYFYPPRESLKQAVEAAHGALYLVGGDIAMMSVYDAGLKNVTCTFGDSGIDDTLAGDLKAFGVGVLYLLPDRDESGQRWACNVRDALIEDLDITLIVQALPYPVEPSHGKDVNDLWLELGCDPVAFRERLVSLPAWRLPEPEPVFEPVFRFDDGLVDLPPAFLSAVENALGNMGGFNSEGWSRKHVRCPFHDDATPSANWNNKLHILRCQSQCGKSYLAKDVGDKLGFRLADYFDRTESVPVSKSTPAPTASPSKPLTTTPVTLRPDLPADVILTSAQERIGATGRKWLDDYLSWATEASPLTPPNLQEAMALWLLAAISTRRMKITVGGEDIYPNLYVLVVCRTSLYRKTTAMKLTLKLLQRANLESLLLPVDATPEALFDELAGVRPANFESLSFDEQQSWRQGRAVAAQRAIFKDEVSSILVNLKKEYMGGLAELLLQGYDGDAGKLTKLLKSKGRVTVRDMCLSFLGATTPAMYGKYIGSEETENGFVARFAILTPDEIPEYRFIDKPVDIPYSLVLALRSLFMDVLPWHDGEKPGGSSRDIDVRTPPAMSVQAEAVALQQLHRYRKAIGYDMLRDETVDDSKAAAYTRLGTMAFKVAMLLAAIETEQAPVRIAERHAYAAQSICERWRESLHRLDRDVARVGGVLEDKLLAYLRSAKETGASLKDIKRDCPVKDDRKIEEALRNLGEEGSIEKFDAAPQRSGPGRKSWRFRAIK